MADQQAPVAYEDDDEPTSNLGKQTIFTVIVLVVLLGGGYLLLNAQNFTIPNIPCGSTPNAPYCEGDGP